MEADTDCTIAEERIFFLADLDIRKRFVAADVHCADNAETFAMSDFRAVFDRRFVFFELVFFLRNVGFAHEDEFRAEQANASCAEVLNSRISISRRANVCNEFNFFAVESDSGLIFQLCIMGFKFFLLLNLLVVAFAFFIRGTNQNFASLAVEDNGVAVSDLSNAVAHADNRRDSTSLSNNNSMSCRGADAEDNARDFIGWKSRDNGRFNILARDDDFADDFRFFNSEQIFRNAFADVAHIDSTSAEVFVFHLFKDLGVGFVSIEDSLGSRAADVDLRINCFTD